MRKKTEKANKAKKLHMDSGNALIHSLTTLTFTHNLRFFIFVRPFFVVVVIDFDLDDLSSPPPPPPTSLPPPLPLEFDGGGMLGDVSINDNDDEAMADERDAERDREISSLNKQIYDLEVLLTAKHKELLAKDEEAAARIKQVEEKAM